MKYLFLSTIFFVLLFHSGCYKIYCNKPPMSLRIAGFDSSDLAFFYFSEYQKNSDFSKLLFRKLYIRTTNLNLVQQQVSSTKSDTVYYSARTPVEVAISIDANFDYSVETPATNGVYKINTISFGNEYTQAGGNGQGCTATATWYLNGELQKYAGYYYGDGSAEIEIKK